ncbi:MAG TPA: hypothetical protein PLL10_05155 [Elusimicrobiales bacterium]|nr:hypothetical protein [Elusimicrobiales bacterium]
MSKFILAGIALCAPMFVCAQPEEGARRQGPGVCAADVKKFCAEVERRDVPRCIEKHKAELSQECRTEHEKRSAMRKQRQAEGQEGMAPGSEGETEAAMGEQPGGQGQPGQGQKQGRRQRMGADPRKACSSDVQKFCPGLEREQVRACLDEHKVELSSACASAITSAKKQRRRQLRGENEGGQDGETMGPPPGEGEEMGPPPDDMDQSVSSDESNSRQGPRRKGRRPPPPPQDE